MAYLVAAQIRPGADPVPKRASLPISFKETYSHRARAVKLLLDALQGGDGR